MSTQTISKRMYLIRALALCSIVLAHSCYQSIQSLLDRYFFARYASIGVVIFFFTSGYYFKEEKPISLFKKLFLKIIVPWFFCGTALFLLSIFKGSPFSLMSYTNYILGNGSYLYYCTVYIVIRMLLSVLPMGNSKARTVLSCIFVVVNIVSLELTAFGVIPNSVFADKWFFMYLSPYMNIFNWIGFVGLGILAKDCNMIEKLVEIKRPYKLLLILACIVVVCLGYCDSYYGYFGKFSFFCEISILIVALLFVFTIPECSMIKPVIQTAKNSFVIYLIHYPFLSLLCYIELLKQSAVFALLRPVVCIIIIEVLLRVFEFILRKLKFEKIIYILLGVRPYEK